MLHSAGIDVAKTGRSWKSWPARSYRHHPDAHPESHPECAATKLLDHIDGWQKAYADDIATIHVRKAGAMHTAEPVIDPVAH
jgi:hypothetical protein